MIGEPPIARRPFHRRAMATRPPGFARPRRPHNRVMWTIFPSSVDRSGPGDDHHMAGRRPGRPALPGKQVEPAIPAQHLGAFKCRRLDDPVLRDRPPLIDLLDRPVPAQPVIADPHPRAAIQEQIAFTVLAHRMAGVDIALDVQVDGGAPWPFHPVGMDDENLAGNGRPRRKAGIGRIEHRNIDEIATFMLGDVQRPDRTQRRGQRRPHRPPVHQIARMPDHDRREIVEGRKGRPIVVAILQYVGIRPIPRQHRVQKAAIAKVRQPLALGAIAPGRRRGTAIRRPRLAQPRHRQPRRRSQSQKHRVTAGMGQDISPKLMVSGPASGPLVHATQWSETQKYRKRKRGATIMAAPLFHSTACSALTRQRGSDRRTAPCACASWGWTTPPPGSPTA